MNSFEPYGSARSGLATNMRVVYEGDPMGELIASEVWEFRGEYESLMFTMRDIDVALFNVDGEYCLVLKNNDSVVLSIDACVVDCV